MITVSAWAADEASQEQQGSGQKRKRSASSDEELASRGLAGFHISETEAAELGPYRHLEVRLTDNAAKREFALSLVSYNLPDYLQSHFCFTHLLLHLLAELPPLQLPEMLSAVPKLDWDSLPGLINQKIFCQLGQKDLATCRLVSNHWWYGIGEHLNVSSQPQTCMKSCGFYIVAQ